MAFTVTPTSGTAPYLYEAEIANRIGFDLGLYITEYRFLEAVGSCPANAVVGPNSTGNAFALLNTGSFTSQSPVPAGSCRSSVFLVRRISDGTIVSQMSVDINNV